MHFAHFQLKYIRRVQNLLHFKYFCNPTMIPGSSYLP